MDKDKYVNIFRHLVESIEKRANKVMEMMITGKEMFKPGPIKSGVRQETTVVNK